MFHTLAANFCSWENELAPAEVPSTMLSNPFFTPCRVLVLPFFLFSSALFLLASGAAPAANFTDATVAAGLNTTGYTFGDPIWGDFDGDGNLDLFVDNHYNRGSYLYHNNGDGTLNDIRSVSGLRAAGDRHGSAWVDFNNDGLLDLS